MPELPAVIGVTCSWDDESEKYQVHSFYLRAVSAAGGIPLVLPDCIGENELKELLGLLDGLLLTGGGDVDPAYFGEEPIPASGRIAPLRDAFEVALVRQGLAADLPILGICRGMQVLNIAAGGNIYQDISTQIAGSLKHCQQAPYWAGTHSIEIQEGTLLQSILQEKTIRVNSFHHQAVRDPAPGFIVSALAKDGVVEAIESPSRRFVLGVQCHPEGMWEKDRRFLKLFTALVEASFVQEKNKKNK
ncbi:MAG: gamma-glutamyl-gamma-aminobutyrate hydrolase family protein [Desulfotomaculales bacterium]